MTSIETRVAPIERPDCLYIGGEWVPAASGRSVEVVQPATEEIYLRVAEAGPEDMDLAVTAARRAFDETDWPRLSHAERAGYLRAIADEVRRRADDLSRIWTSEMGIVHAAAKLSTPGFGNVWDQYADLAASFEFVERHEPVAGEVGYLVREPVGVVGAIVPWNGPLALIGQKVAPALLAGCTTVVKMSPEAPGAGYVMAEIADTVGLPPGVFNLLTADRDVSELLVRDPRVDKIAFTGSTAAGRRIASLCGERIARYTLELGGKSAAVVLDDYEIDAVARSLAASAPRMTGQVCASLTRIIVSERRHDDLVDALCDSLSRVVVGDPFDEGTQMGPLAMSRQRDRVEGLISAGVSEGAVLARGGKRPAHLERGYYIEPTVFGRVDNSSTIAREEIFGPVLSVIPARDEDDAVRLANDSIYGLNASVFTHDVDRAYDVARRLRSGTVGHNAQRIDFGIAFGGFKQSGIGREGGREGLYPYLEAKTIILDAEPRLPAQ